jgi:hypothetical protein
MSSRRRYRPYLTRADLWYIYDLDNKYDEMQSRRMRLEQVVESIKRILPSAEDAQQFPVFRHFKTGYQQELAQAQSALDAAEKLLDKTHHELTDCELALDEARTSSSNAMVDGEEEDPEKVATATSCAAHPVTAGCPPGAGGRTGGSATPGAAGAAVGVRG